MNINVTVVIGLVEIVLGIVLFLVPGAGAAFAAPLLALGLSTLGIRLSQPPTAGGQTGGVHW